jgi:translation elongation factor P/translation initiation factor 5A
MINVSDLKPGVTFQMDGNLFVVLDYSHNKTARAAANVKVKMKNLRTGSTTEMTFGGNDKVKRAQIDKKEVFILSEYIDQKNLLKYFDRKKIDYYDFSKAACTLKNVGVLNEK